MGQKTHPKGFRLAVNKDWSSRWYAEGRLYASWLEEDLSIQEFLKKELASAGVASINIERSPEKVKVIIRTPRPGIVIGKKGAGIEALKIKLQNRVKSGEVLVNIVEVRKAETEAQLVAENVAMQLERRVAFRRAMKKAMETSMKFGAKGVRIACRGRLGGGDMARYEWYLRGRVPLHTLRADVQYGFAKAKTTYGIIGVKCWIFKGENLPKATSVAA